MGGAPDPVARRTRRYVLCGAAATPRSRPLSKVARARPRGFGGSPLTQLTCRAACTLLISPATVAMRAPRLEARASARREPRSVVTLIKEETVVSRLNDAPLRAEGASAPFA